MELLTVDNKFRKYVKKDKNKIFVETTELDAYNLKVNVDDLTEKFGTLSKNLFNDIQSAVRKSTAHLREKQPDGMNPASIDGILV